MRPGSCPGRASSAPARDSTRRTISDVFACSAWSEHSKDLELVLTSRASTLEGTVTDEKGEPAENVMILMIPEDKASWNRLSPRLRMGFAPKAGQFTIGNVLAGRYYVVAAARDAAYMPMDAGTEAFEALTKEATMVVVGEDEKRTVDLRVTRGLQEPR